LRAAALANASHPRKRLARFSLQAKIRMIYFNASMHMKVYVKRPEAILSIHNAFVTTYVCGASTHFFYDKVHGAKEYDPLVKRETGRRSLIPLAVSWNEKLPMFLSLTGTIASSTVFYNTSDMTEAKEVQYNMAPYYCWLYGFRKALPSVIANSNLRRPNQICLRAAFDTFNNGTWERQEGNGHWKNEMNAEVRTITQHIATTAN
jgi:hypothetical protein